MEIATIFIPLVFFDVDMMIVWDISRHYPYALLLITTVAHINYTAYNNYAIFFRGGWNIKTLRWSRTAQSKPRKKRVSLTICLIIPITEEKNRGDL